MDSPVKDIRSGAASQATPNSAIELAKLIGSLLNEDGRIALPGFYDDVQPPSDERRRELAALPFTEEDWLTSGHGRRIAGEADYTVLEQLWERPSVKVTSMIAGDPIGPSRAAIPAVATASISFRTVPGQTPARLAGARPACPSLVVHNGRRPPRSSTRSRGLGRWPLPAQWKDLEGRAGP